MPKQKIDNISTGTSTLTLLFVAFIGGLIAVLLQPFIHLLYSQIGISTMPVAYQHLPNPITLEPTLTTTIVSIATTIKPESTTTISMRKSALDTNDPTIDEEIILLKDKPLNIKHSESTTIKSTVNDKSKQSKIDQKKTSDKSEDIPQSVKLKKVNQQPELIDVTGRNKHIPDEVKNFKSMRISKYILQSFLFL